MSKIKRNAFRCKQCGLVVESKTVHDFQECRCGNFTDGGLDYVRRGGNFDAMEDLTEYEEELKERAGRQALNDFREEEYRETKERLENLMHDNHRDLSHEAVIVDNFWVEIAEHFRAIAELCEERSKK